MNHEEMMAALEGIEPSPDEMAAEERDARTRAKFVEHARTLGRKRVRLVVTSAGLVVVSAVGSDAAYAAFRDETNSQKEDEDLRTQIKAKAAVRFGATCVIEPTKAEYKAMCAAFPGIPDVVGVAALKLAGAMSIETAGKS